MICEKPRVNKKKRLVCVHWHTLGMFEIVKINNKGTINKNYSSRTSFDPDMKTAFKKMGVPINGFKTVTGARKILEAIKGKWEDYPAALWQKFSKQ
jgi:hypothetical protein